jgi:hypothetical protein
MLPLALAAWAAMQEPGAWTVRPAAPTVGDTVWLERRIPTPADWSVRPGRLGLGGDVEPLAAPAVRPEAGGWVVRYPVVAWTPGPHAVELPLLWRLGPMGEADSEPGGIAAFRVVSVLPDTGRPEPRPARAPVRAAHRRPVWPAATALLALGLLAATLRWRRRGPRGGAGPVPAPSEGEVDDAAWLGVGEPRAVAARAAAQLRAAVARAVPEAHRGLTTEECLAALACAQPGRAGDELAEVLRGLDRVAFASAPEGEIAALAGRARALAAGTGRRR